jgi:VWFA-related protein
LPSGNDRAAELQEDCHGAIAPEARFSVDADPPHARSRWISKRGLSRRHSAVGTRRGLRYAEPASQLAGGHHVRLTFTLAVAGALSAILAAQQPSQPEQRQTFKTEANFVRVDVYPTKNGQPIQNLTAADFELLEDGVPQSIQTFEHVIVRAAGPQEARVEPNAVQQAEQMAANPRNRVFVVFLDVPHVAYSGSHAIKEPLIRLLDRVLGPDDLVAVMTPEMSPSQLTFGRKTQVIAQGLRDNWPWGVRSSILPMDERERQYEICYPPLTNEASPGELVREMVHRRRERMVLEALHDMVNYLANVREERKAILTVTEGWTLFRPDTSMTNLRRDPITGAEEPVPGRVPIGVDPDNGKLTTKPRRTSDGNVLSRTECDSDRMTLAAIDNERYFRDLLDLANRYNASFYPIDPRGLPVFDSPVPPAVTVAPSVDQRRLAAKLDILRTLADSTDGIAVLNNNNLDRGLKRIADDLTSYYLLGYYTSNPKLDGRFRSIKVRVKQPGVDVRARRGYRMPTLNEVGAARAAAGAPAVNTNSTLNAAFATLARIRSESRFRIHAVPALAADGSMRGVWVAGEVDASAADLRTQALAATIDISGQGLSANAAVHLQPGVRTFMTFVPVTGAAVTFDVRATLTADVHKQERDAVKVDPRPGQALLFRRGQSTGNRWVPAADFRFSRIERLRLEIPIANDAKPGAARLLDKAGAALPIPVTAAERTDESGQRWLTAEAILAALGAGDYAIELTYSDSGAEQRTIAAVRVTR